MNSPKVKIPGLPSKEEWEIIKAENSQGITDAMHSSWYAETEELDLNIGRHDKIIKTYSGHRDLTELELITAELQGCGLSPSKRTLEFRDCFWQEQERVRHKYGIGALYQISRLSVTIPGPVNAYLVYAIRIPHYLKRTKVETPAQCLTALREADSIFGQRVDWDLQELLDALCGQGEQFFCFDYQGPHILHRVPKAKF